MCHKINKGGNNNIMKQGKIYPAVFEKGEKYILVSFPDLEGCQTQGINIEEAYRFAREALALYLDGLENAPVPSSIESLKAPSGGYVMLIEADTADNIVYFKKTDIPQIIKEKLTERGYTKYKLAKILDVNEGYINLITKGTRTPSPEMAKRIGLTLGFDWQIFFA